MMSGIIHVIIRAIDRSGISCRMRPTWKRGLSIMAGSHRESGEPCCTVGSYISGENTRARVRDLLSVTKL